jgi:AcrR family transcriptional regulator
VRRTDRRIRRTQKALHAALISLVLEKDYDSITVQEILDRADIGRSTFYLHFGDKDQLLISGMENLKETLNAAIEQQRVSLTGRQQIIDFSEAMFQHAHEYRNVYYALLHTTAWPIVRQRLQEVLDELIRRESKNEIVRIKRAESDTPVDLFVHYITSTFFAVLTWWLDRRSRLKPSEINSVFRSLVLPTIAAVLR